MSHILTGAACLWEAGQDDLLQKEEFADPPCPDPLIGAKPVKLSVAHVAKRENLTGAFVNLRPEAALCLISFQLWKSLSLFGGSTQPKGCQSSVSSCLLWRLMGHVCEYVCVRVSICVQNSVSVVNFVCLGCRSLEMR